MFNRILVPLDGSPLAERAIPHAKHFARIFGGKIILLQVLDPTPYREYVSSVEPLSWQIRKTETDLYLKEAAERIRGEGIPAEHVLLEGRPPENIVDFAQNENIDLLVLTTHGAGGLTRWNTSSVVTKVIEKAYLPLLIIRAYNQPGKGMYDESSSGETTSSESLASESETGDRSTESGGSRGMSSRRIETPNQRTLAGSYVPVTSAAAPHLEDDAVHYRRILLPIDTSRRAECSVAPGIGILEGEERLCGQAGEMLTGEGGTNGTPAVTPQEPVSTLLLGAVIRPPEMPVPPPYPEELQQLSDQFMKISREAVNSYLAEIQARIPMRTENRIVENESISAAIHELAEKENVDLVILCAHGMTGRINWPYGSVARNYIDYGTQNVLIIQDVPRAQIRQTAAEIAAEKYGRR